MNAQAWPRAEWRELSAARKRNALGLAVGLPLPDWAGAAPLPGGTLAGRYCRLAPLDAARHGRDLFDALCRSEEAAGWTYLNQGPFACLEDWLAWLRGQPARVDARYYAIVDAGDGQALGLAGFLGIAPADGCIELGGLHFSARLRRSRLATEAIYLMLRHVFELGYRRCEWRCDAQNQASLRAALRLGFTFEALWRQRRVAKGRNRDAACFSIIDQEWPARRAALAAWLREDNFDGGGAQRCTLAQIVAMQERNRAAGFMPAVGGATMGACNR
ncbi:GNAT family N-acetyltransferase [Chromobacterium subtsugae]|uniref:GNAT family N-acetyltransferase n=1 Tax=Chromobacterium subtsugae TaxID=251747 RepID=UPI0007F909F5|nr:GNAT family protein [Chromobacterium subtsugae]